MGRKLYVGNLAYGVRTAGLQQMFEPFGTVESAQVIMDRDTAAPRGSASSRWAATRRPRRPSPP